MTKVKKADLHNALKELCRIAKPNVALPFSETIRLEAREGTLTMIANDLEDALIWRIQASGDLDPICLKADNLKKLTKPAGKKDGQEMVELEKTDGNKCKITIGAQTVTINGLDSSDFPDLPETTKSKKVATIEQPDELLQAIKFLLPAVCKNVTRYNLSGMYCAKNGDMVSTDGDRLHLFKSSVCLPDLIVRKKAFEILAQIAEEPINVYVEKNVIAFKTDKWEMVSLVIDDCFPEYSYVFPKEEERKCQLTVNSGELSSAIESAEKLINPKDSSTGVVFCVNGSIAISVNNPDLGKFETVVVTTKNDHQGEDLICMFNPRYLQDAVKLAGETVDLSFCDSLGPLVLNFDDKKVAIVMPMQIKN